MLQGAGAVIIKSNGNNERIRVLSDGTVGIGTTSTTLSTSYGSQLSVTTTSSTLTTCAVRMHNPGGFGPVSLEFISDPGGSDWRPGYIVSGDAGTYTGKIMIYTNGTGSGNKYGATAGLTVTNGSVGIGTTAPSTTYGKLHVWTSMAYGGNNTGRLTGSGNTVTIVNSTGEVRELVSSRKYKKDITPYTAGFEKIALLNPVLFKYKSDDNMLCAGLIAEDLADAGNFEEFLTYDGNGDPSGIRYQDMVTLLINGVKELKSENDSLKSEIQSLKDQISSILMMLSNK
jgi:hypothetical protein